MIGLPRSASEERWRHECCASAARVSGKGARQAWTQEQRHASVAAESSPACLPIAVGSADVHFSSPRTELREIKRKNRKTKKREIVLLPPLLLGHADYNNPFEFVTMMRQLEGLEFDVMLEAKAKDLALLRLRTDLARVAPDVAARFGIPATSVTRPPAEEITVQMGNSASVLDR